MSDPAASTPLAGRVIAVTGASRGIGLAIVELLARRGAVVLGGARSAPAAGIGGVQFMALDVTQETSVMAFADTAAALGVDALVNNAGVGSFASLERATVEDYRWMMDTNVLGTFLASKWFIPHFKRRHANGLASQVVNITSDVSDRTFASGGLYTASKHAQRALSRALAFEGRDYGLRVTEIRPGMTDTHFNHRVPGTPERAAHLRPGDIAHAVAQVLGAPSHLRVDEIVLHPVTQDIVF
ncbi:MAG: SDR family oxidoreductase [Burkholderiales bacterium]|nr:SDR family oxidoreductase [Burkholderiales bacterium]